MRVFPTGALAGADRASTSVAISEFSTPQLVDDNHRLAMLTCDPDICHEISISFTPREAACVYRCARCRRQIWIDDEAVTRMGIAALDMSR